MAEMQTVLPDRPATWSQLRGRHGSRTWLATPEWAYLWLVYWSQQWTALKILDAAGKFVIVVAVAQWFLERDSRTKQRHYTAWSIVNSANGTTGDGGRRDALQDLNDDGVDLSVVALAGAYLNGVQLRNAHLSSAVLRSSSLVTANLSGADLSLADMIGTNFTSATLERADLSNAKLAGANFSGSTLHGAKLVQADLSGVTLFSASLFEADLTGAKLDHAMFCRTLMPDGALNNADCPKQAIPSGAPPG